jgi:polyhydroxybutyrate depolymerase
VTCRAIALVVLAACGTSDAPRPKTFGGDRPVDLQVPMGFTDDQQYPLVLVLHGYSANGTVQEAFFGAKSVVTDGSAFVLAPDGLVDSAGNQYWNADPQCCDFDHSGVDDSSYLASLVEDVKAAWPIDRVLVMGHSNGGYMTYRFTCDHADLVDGMVVLAGAYPTTTCTPSRAVPLIHIHGDQDTEVPFDLAMPSVTAWAGDDGCGAFSPGPSYDLDGIVDGAETSSQIASCPAGLDVELWAMAGVGHIPSYTSAFMPTIWGWFTSR